MENSEKSQRDTIKITWRLIFREIQPLFREIVEKFELLHKFDEKENDVVDKMWNVYKLCNDQIRKCILILIEMFNHKKAHNYINKESLQCILERLSCCHQKLQSINSHVDTLFGTSHSITDDSININTMYFVNWIDQTFDILNNLSNTVYETDYKISEEHYEQWKENLVICVSGIHTCIDEMLLSAMTLCKYCLPMDQHIVKARCQVVLRETKALLSDLIKGDLDSVFHASKENLILPIKPSNINVLIDVLKDVLYVLETNTNTALLALLIHCFSYNICPVEKLRDHFVNKCACNEECDFVKEFDVYNERLMQIGSFAISCSSDENRVLSLRSGLASIEGLDSHLVPAVMVAPLSYNASLLVNIWKREVADIRDQVFLIVDPTAFAQRAKQMMHSSLLEIIKDKVYNNTKVCGVINTGCVLSDFFHVYRTNEPDALTHHDKLLPLISDLDKVIPECKIVSNMLATHDDFKYKTKITDSKATFEQLIKRLKLLYTIVNKINCLLSPEEDIFEESIKNETFSVAKTMNKKTMNLTKMFRTNVKSSTAKFPLAVLTKNFKAKTELSFSLKLDEICDISDIKGRNTSILYSPMKKGSLRKALLSRCMKVENVAHPNEDEEDEMLSLQITDVLNDLNNLTKSRRMMNVTYNDNDLTNDLKLSVNETVTNITYEMDEPSNIGTLERINDLKLVTSRLSDLKSAQETSL
ncbi:unnamed protein product [Pieris macdunnoughi]|uniref:Serendipity locus protein alpha n=1 Tax=Pieris macdunnoughi TaxID=345717 RepID=A0A821WQB1_9NEOP|nr:unnamed protein product [Pieris macdunnoughi]